MDEQNHEPVISVTAYLINGFAKLHDLSWRKLT